MRKVRPSWKRGVVLVCTHERTPDAEKPSCGEARGSELRQWLKDRIKAEGLKGQVLAAKTSCLGICSALGHTVEIVAVGGERQTLLLDPATEREALWRQAKAVILGGTPEPIEED